MSDVGGDAGNIDATALLRKIHFLEQKLDDKADKIEVVQARSHTDEMVANSRKEVDKIIDALRSELSNLHERFHMFEKDTFEKLVARVVALENRM
jgi:cell division septum initiation protein DivIVA